MGLTSDLPYSRSRSDSLLYGIQNLALRSGQTPPSTESRIGVFWTWSFEKLAKNMLKSPCKYASGVYSTIPKLFAEFLVRTSVIKYDARRQSGVMY
jgi:hypothetical protein